MTLRQLESLSRIKERREERARQSLQDCLAKLAEVLEACVAAADREKAFAAEVSQRRSELYTAMIGSRLSAGAIERINQQILEMDRQRRHLAEKTEAARSRVRKARSEAETARQDFAAQCKALQKWQSLSVQVEEDMQRAADRASELDLEGDLGDRWLSGHRGPGAGVSHD